MKHKYAVYVSDANGWSDGCPDSEGVFFGSAEEHGGTYCRDGLDLGLHGFVLVEGHRAAIALRNHLNATGDWIAPAEVNPDGIATRPSYGIAKL